MELQSKSEVKQKQQEQKEPAAAADRPPIRVGGQHTRKSFSPLLNGNLNLDEDEEDEEDHDVYDYYGLGGICSFQRQ